MSLPACMWPVCDGNTRIVNGAEAATLTWQCGPPPKPASFRPVECSPWLGWFAAPAIDALPTSARAATIVAVSRRFIAPPGIDRPATGTYGRQERPVHRLVTR